MNLKTLFKPIVSRILGLLNLITPKFRAIFIEGYPSEEINVIFLSDALTQKRVRHYFVINTLENSPSGQYRKNLVKFSLRYWLRLFTSKYIVYTHGLPICKFKESQTVLNLWHGLPFKDISSKNRIGKIYFDYILSYNSVCTKLFREYFDVGKEKILEQGSLRWTYFEENSLNQPTEEKYFLWLPTFRQSKSVNFNDCSASVLFDDKGLEYFNKYLLKSGIKCKIKLHPMESFVPSRQFSNISFVNTDLNELILKSNGLITDISSVMIDYLPLEKPIHIFFPDIECYMKTRGYNEYYKNIIKPFACKSFSELVDRLSTDDRQLQMRLHKTFYRRGLNPLESILNTIDVK